MNKKRIAINTTFGDDPFPSIQGIPVNCSRRS